MIKEKRKIMTHLVAGYPTFNESLRLAKTLADSKSDILEIQIPFSEPVADGPTIVEACHTALKNGFRTEQIFDFCKKASKFNIPLVVMTYANPLLSIGIERFCKKISLCEVVGIIVPDLPFDSEEGKLLYKFSKKYNLNLIHVISPSMDKDRLKQVISLSKEIIYCTTKRGTTGGKNGVLSKDLRLIVNKIKEISNIHIAIGFGISSKKEFKMIEKLANIVVIGSAIIRKFNSTPTKEKYREVTEFLKQIRS